ncbi:hypothetical protein GXW78_18190 [Roseomonas terrae]|uniref:Uncharacterized protein n=1 Tax=Neoroseomonas terrae TaxID=424799 RepID=A0ABS5EKQ8_9PROT|nr:hypothetical protein [Neoroseomonas terrae]MBR0651606.1 hypothetical protein [Neoroseomonas terrae]
MTNFETKPDGAVREVYEGSRGQVQKDPNNSLAAATAARAEAELMRRGLMNPKTRRLIKQWTSGEVEDVMQPFIALSKSVPGNQRLPLRGFTSAGGAKRTGEMFIDAYTGVTTDRVNFVLVAYAKKRGDVPWFGLYDMSQGGRRNRNPGDAGGLSPNDALEIFSPADLVARGLPIWKDIIKRA